MKVGQGRKVCKNGLVGKNKNSQFKTQEQFLRKTIPILKSKE
jgi:hypothetical protein